MEECPRDELLAALEAASQSDFVQRWLPQVDELITELEPKAA